jgi:ribonuclease P protein component
MTLGVLHGTGDTKVGIITSKRVGSAVNRNRVRRRLREILRLARPQWASGFWLVIIARNRAADATFAELHAEWVKLAKRSGILNSTETPESP